MVALLKAAGAVVLSRPPVRAEAAESSQPPGPARTSVVMWPKGPQRKGGTSAVGVRNVTASWLLDSASTFQVQPLEKYTL